MRTTYVTGASGSGKTTLHERLIDTPAPDDGSFIAAELDDIGGPLPATADVPWLQWRATEFLHAAIERHEAGEQGHLVVTGIVWPFSLITSNVWARAMAAGVEVRFLHLDRPWADVAATLSERYADWDDAEDAAEQVDNNRRLQRLLRTQVGMVKGGLVVEGGNLDVAAELINGPAW